MYDVDYSQLNEADLAYAAGLIDGEGCIAICHNKPDSRHSNSRYYLRLVVTMCDRIGVRWLEEKFGGTLHERPDGSWRKANMKRQWRWCLGGGPDVARFLTAIMPWLKVKKAQAELALLFQTTVFPRGGDVRYTRRNTPEKLENQRSMFLRMKELKRVEAA